jgi:hypothetical protein
MTEAEWLVVIGIETENAIGAETENAVAQPPTRDG